MTTISKSDMIFRRDIEEDANTLNAEKRQKRWKW